MIDPVIQAFYEDGRENERVYRGGDMTLECTRILELTRRLLPPPPADVIDVGGGSGLYAAPLRIDGYDVFLIDPIPGQILAAKKQGIRAELGDARNLNVGDGEQQDAVLLYGPLYHLTDRQDRLKALAEARRVLKPGGKLLATAISRWSSMMYAVFDGWLDDPAIRAMVKRDLATGQHRNPWPDDPRFFTTAYFHTPAGLAAEISEAGFSDVEVYGVEGPGWPVDWRVRELRAGVLAAARKVEREPSMIGFSQNFLAAATA